MIINLTATFNGSDLPDQTDARRFVRNLGREFADEVRRQQVLDEVMG
ncbi:hypothetical protein [Euzebya sp.]